MVRLVGVAVVLAVLTTAGGASGAASKRAIALHFTSRDVLRPEYGGVSADGAIAATSGGYCTGLVWRARPRPAARLFAACGGLEMYDSAEAYAMTVGGNRVTWLAYASSSHGTYEYWEVLQRDLRTGRVTGLASSYTNGGYGYSYSGLLGGGSLFAYASAYTDLTEEDTTYLLPAGATADTRRCPPSGANRCVAVPGDDDLVDVDGGRALAYIGATKKWGLLGPDAKPHGPQYDIALPGSSTAKLAGQSIVALRTDTQQIQVYDVRTGKQTATWPAPGARSLIGAGGGFVLYGTGAVHVMRLRDGAEAKIAMPRELRFGGADLTSAGLFYLYRVRIRHHLHDVLGFEPSARLGAQLGAARR